jgi:hypothetical protein
MTPFFRSIHRWRAAIAAVVLAGALLVAEPPAKLIVELCLWATVIVIAYDMDEPTDGRLPFWTLVGVLGAVAVLLAYGGIWV